MLRPGAGQTPALPVRTMLQFTDTYLRGGVLPRPREG